jgi:hypothetical protein
MAAWTQISDLINYNNCLGEKDGELLKKICTCF